jgi:hypothetical protein
MLLDFHQTSPELHRPKQKEKQTKQIKQIKQTKQSKQKSKVELKIAMKIAENNFDTIFQVKFNINASHYIRFNNSHHQNDSECYRWK